MNEVRVTYLNTTFIPTPFSDWTAPQSIADSGFSSLGRGPKIEISGGVAHIAYVGRPLGSGDAIAPHYFQRRTGFGIGGPQVFESHELIAASDVETELELALDGAGGPQVLFVRAEGSQNWRVESGRRVGTDDG